MSRIAVVGAGLMGRLTALHLHQRGYRVSLFEKGDKSGDASAARAAGGLLTPLGESLHSKAWVVEMGFASIELWPILLQGLEKWVYFQREGSIVVAHGQDGGDMLRFTRHIQSHWPQYPAQSLDREGLAKLEPELSRSFNQGLYLPQEAQLGNRLLLKALCHELEKQEIHWQCQTEINDVNVLTGDFDLVIDCRGVGASKQMKDLRGVRGELFQLLAPEVKLNRPVRLMHPRYSLYIAPKPNRHYVVGATEIESDDDSPMTVRSALELLSAAYSVHPGFAEATILKNISQCRPAFNDNDPKIRISNNVISVNGLYRHGFLIAPVVLNHLLQAVDVKQGKKQSVHYQFPQLIEEYEL